MVAVTDELLTPDRVFREHAPRVYNLARRMLGNDADAEDVTQDVLMQVIRKLDTFRGDSAFSTWLHRVTVNASLACRRKRARRDTGRVYDPLENFTEDGHHEGFIRPWPRLPDSPVLEKEEKELIEKGMTSLPEMYRDVFVLADIEQLPNSEIADMLEMSVPAVKSRLHRARLMMRDFLSRYFEERVQ